MRWATHTMIGVSSLWLLSPILQQSDGANAGVLAACAALGALMPDLDASESKIKHLGLYGIKPFSLPAMVLYRQLGHRGLLHSLLGMAPPIAWGRDMKIARDLLQAYSLERLKGLLNQFFASDDAWYRKRGYSLPCFMGAIPKLLMREGRTLLAVQNSSWRNPSLKNDLRKDTGWQRASNISHEDYRLFQKSGLKYFSPTFDEFSKCYWFVNNPQSTLSAHILTFEIACNGANHIGRSRAC